MDKIFGQYGVILDINLSTNKINKTQISKIDLKNYLGGRGLGMKILWDRIKKPGIDPLSPENIIMFMPGPFSGLPIPSSSRTTIVTKSPRTSPINKKYEHSSTISYANMGGFFGPEVKFAGYDGIVVTGKASSPVFILIEDDKVQIKSAESYWGLGTDSLDKKLIEEYGKNYQSCYIGQGGENLIPYASVLNTAARAAGRGGVGAVMGSKNLKAILVKGTQQPNLAKHKMYLDLLEKTRTAFQEDKTGGVISWRTGGTADALERSSDNGTMAVKNYREGTFKEIEKINTKAARTQIWKRDFACFSCQLACKKSGFAKGAYGGVVHDGPEYETGTMLGANLLISDLEGLNKMIYICDDYGIDIISTGGVLGFLMECREKGLIDLDFLDGVDLTWGNVDASIEMIHKIVKRDGVGKWAAMGVKALAKRIGQGSEEFAIHVKGHELAAWNVNTNASSMMITYGTANRGACHLNSSNPVRQNTNALRDSLGACSFAGSWYKGDISYRNFIEAITGAEQSDDEFNLIGERIFNLEKMFNLREGFDDKDDHLPERFFKDAHTYGKGEGKLATHEDFTKWIEAYYAERGWDVKTSKPKTEKLSQLGLDFTLQS
ncbi:MAG: aldehyde:ferredoxin oxidoreductase [Bacteroidetes bacterium HGW-Bacteroidetes-17]|jgi:aldehyde:ferredoxin oxidoreductase|nr:MAG: aldehyde:ferredoxin oxidoreductase [Bacteroidetes bacterium HGW-Bacteroidetes-17]